MRRLSVWIDLIGMGQALAGHGPASGPASGARKRSGRTLQRPRPWWSSRNACEQFSAEMLASGSGQFPSKGGPFSGPQWSEKVTFAFWCIGDS